MAPQQSACPLGCAHTTRVKVTVRKFGISILIVLISLLFVECGSDDKILRPSSCKLIDGEIEVQFREDVTQEFAIEFLDGLGLVYGQTGLTDRYGIWVLVVEGDPQKLADQLESYPEISSVVIVWGYPKGEVSFYFRVLGDDLLRVLETIDLNNRLAINRVIYFPKRTIVEVPIGEEEQWEGALRQHDFIESVNHVLWCPPD